jgi:hypothetical protein
MDGMYSLVYVYYRCVFKSELLIIGLRYPYPLFTMLDMTQRIGLFTASALLMAVVTALLKWLYGRVNGYTVPMQKPGSLESS